MMSMINKTYKNATSVLNRYVVGLLLTEGKKSCSGMGSCLALSHDKLYSSLTFISGNFELIQNFALRIIKKYSVADKGWLIVDDTAVTKVYSKVIQGVVWMYNVLARREQKQLNILVLAWTNDVITIPLDFELWYPKNACDTYQTKNEYNFIYYISTVRKTAKEYVKIYELRWNIEKIFRTMKQSLGLKDCSARKGTMQKGHIFGIFHAYTIAQIIKTEKIFLMLRAL